MYLIAERKLIKGVVLRFKNRAVFLVYLLSVATVYPNIKPIERVEPPSWWTHFTDRKLEILVYGDKIGDTKRVSVYNKLNQKELNKCFLDAITKKQPASKGNKTPEIFTISQYKTAPPGFKFESNNYDLIHFSYKRYLENKIRENFDFSGCPISLKFVKGKRR